MYKVLPIVIRPMRKRWVWTTALLEGNINACSVLVIKSEEEFRLGDRRGDGRVILKCALTMYGLRI
jgi:hypothetical protein